MADPAQIADALLARCTTLSVGSPVLPIAYPDVAFTPPANGKYLQVDLFFNRPAWEGLSNAKADQGILQVTVVWPKNQGIKALSDAAEVMTHFPKGLIMANGVRISSEPHATTPLMDDIETRVPVTIRWMA